MSLSPTFPENLYTLTDERQLPAPAKARILLDWRTFIRAGFRKSLFTPALYQFLGRSCAFTAYYPQEVFWQAYFSSDPLRLRAFLNQFGGSGLSAEFGTPSWLGGEYLDLKEALCQEMNLVYGALVQVLSDLERQHQALILVWQQFAQAHALQPLPPPPLTYQIDENTRALLAFAAEIALQHQARQRQPEALPLQLPLLELPS